MDQLIVTWYQGALLTLHLKDGAPYRLHLAFPEAASGPAIGDIYRARVQHVNAGLKNAFLELGEGQRAYLNTEEGETLKPGEELTVLITQEGVGDKLPTASRELTIPGEWLVLSSDPGFLGFSRRAGFDGPQREAIHEILSPYYTDCGFIIRTAAEQAPLECLAQEAETLSKEYRSLLQKAEHSPAPKKLAAGAPLYLEWFQGLDKSACRLITDQPEVFEQAAAYLRARNLPEELLQLYTDESLSLAALYRAEKALSEARDRKVWLKSGAYLVIQRTEAMTVIDVNSGKNENQGKEVIQRINQEAAREVARQLILRNMSGMILVDFINMKETESEKKLLEYLRSLVRQDPVFTQVVDITPLGLVEITRRRIRRPL